MTTFFRTLHCTERSVSFSEQHQEIPDDQEKFWGLATLGLSNSLVVEDTPILSAAEM